MSNAFHLDYETRSRADLKKYGAYRYASDSSTQIILAAVALEDGPVKVWDYSDPDSDESRDALELICMAAEGDDLVYAHNAPFEIAISTYLWQSTFGCAPPALTQWRCTAAMARRAALLHSLADVGSILKLDVQKDKRGDRLIKLFCEPGRNSQFLSPDAEGTVTVLGEKVPVAEAWQMFREYNRKDVMVEQAVHRKLAAFELQGTALDSFQFDLRMNQRGLPVNRDALLKAGHIVAACSESEIARCQALCGLVPTQVTKLLPWLRDHGYPGFDLRAETMEQILDNGGGQMEPQALEVLQIRYRTAYSAVKKIPTMLNAACPDGRVRGALMWSGAIRTHRWSGKIIQPHNFKRPSIKNTHEAYEDICNDLDHETLALLYGNPVEVVASCIRHFIHGDCEFLDADYSNIEFRLVLWLAGQTDKLQNLRNLDTLKLQLKAAKATGSEADIAKMKARVKLADPYNIMGGKIFSVNPANADDFQRFVGKQTCLGCGYQMGPPKFQASCAKYGQDLPDELCETAVKVYRQEHPEVVGLWKAMQGAAVAAIENPGQTYKVRGKISFKFTRKVGFPALLMILPSGHRLVYPWPALRTVWIFQKQKYETEAAAMKAYRVAEKAGTLEEEDRVWSSRQISFMGSHPMTKKWSRLTTYGGSLTENACQAIAGDFITEGMLGAERAGYETFLMVHDQALSNFRPENGHSVEGFREALCRLPDWAPDFPLAAECSVMPFYSKD